MGFFWLFTGSYGQQTLLSAPYDDPYTSVSAVIVFGTIVIEAQLYLRIGTDRLRVVNGAGGSYQSSVRDLSRSTRGGAYGDAYSIPGVVPDV